MSHVEYKVITAPTRGRKAPGVKTPEDRFALGLEETLNEMARGGWRYLRSDILPSLERQGLTSSQTVYRSVLVFERDIRPAETAGEPLPEAGRSTVPAVRMPTPPTPPRTRD